ncbi:LysE family transporter [Glaciecola sp. XM2]|jgi:RhtB (resistance to homoserine/threonine) family protein|uniref:LysE family translocator n=1 Tax=Glaciecola sp. XM2 TaxID=1914931 RepID=UPI001BDE286D|nr:LysE family transporter [Glaciecola sp. XM2]MBT1449628.1 LysE family transporter [Glaciecola sp. XM2]
MMDFSLAVWASIAVMHAFAVASPGPDFAVVMKQSLQHGRRLGIITSVGVGVGILLHVLYSILGVSLIIQATSWLYQTLIYAAALYLVWMGISGLRSRPTQVQSNETASVRTQSAPKAFMIGFITNGLNPKATLFFLTLYTLAIPAQTSLLTKGVYGLYLAFATACWFILVSILVSHSRIRQAYLKKGFVFDRVMGAVLIIMAIILVVTQ